MTQATPTDPLGVAYGFTRTSACAHCGQVVERVVGEPHWSHVDSQRRRCNLPTTPPERA